jgi:DNA recombination protein RmuC
MEIFLFTLSFILITTNIALILKLFNREKELQKIASNNSTLLERSNNLNNTASGQQQKISSLEEQNCALLVFKGRFNEAENTIQGLNLQIHRNKEELSKLTGQISDSQKENGLLDQEKENLKKEKEEWGDKKQQILFQLTEELIKKNNLQQDDFSKKQKEVIEQTVSGLNEKFTNILNKVGSLDDDVKKTFKDINFTKNALLSPGGAGKIAEITLENILKASGLKEKNNMNEAGDFILQAHFLDQNKVAKRPDAMVFLPKDHILIIDSKSSSHFLELQQAFEDGDDGHKKEIELKLKESMKRHLGDLKKRDYANAKAEELDLKDFAGTDRTPVVTTIMFLQTEKMLEIIRNIDSEFERKALELGIQILSPVGLINLLHQVRFLIDNIRQEKNIEKLRIEIRKLMESIGTMFKRSSEMGDTITKSLKTYNKFAGTFNSRFLPRIINMNKLGIKSEGKNTIEKLKKISLDGDLIEAEVLEDLPDSSTLE